jgi:hypothetical protein
VVVRLHLLGLEGGDGIDASFSRLQGNFLWGVITVAGKFLNNDIHVNKNHNIF